MVDVDMRPYPESPEQEHPEELCMLAYPESSSETEASDTYPVSFADIEAVVGAEGAPPEPALHRFDDQMPTSQGREDEYHQLHEQSQYKEEC